MGSVFCFGLLALLTLTTQASGQQPAARQRSQLVGQWWALAHYGPDTTRVTLVFRPNGTGALTYAQRLPIPFTYSLPAPNRLQLVRGKERSIHFIYRFTPQEFQLGPPPEREKFAEVMETLFYRRR